MGKKTGMAGSFGSRYGTKPRKRYTQIMKMVKGKHECPSCGQRVVQRKSFGIWLCKKCGYEFAGGAYMPITKTGIVARRVSQSSIKKASETPEQKNTIQKPESENQE